MKPQPISEWNCPWAKAAEEWLAGVAWSYSAGHSEMDVRAGVRFDRETRWLGVISSHFGHESWREPGWQRILEDALRFARETRSVVLYSGATPYADAVRHACERLGVPCASLRVVEARGTGQRLEDGVRLHRTGGLYTARESSRVEDSALCDAAVTILSHRLFAIQVRPKGKVSQWLQRRLSEPSVSAGTTWVACGPNLDRAQRDLRFRLNARGAVLWLQTQSDSRALGERIGWNDSSARRLGCAGRIVPSTLQPIGSLMDWGGAEEDYLVHCTRARRGPWPDQSHDEYLDESLQLDTCKRSTPFETLHRIVTTQRLVATRWMRRGDLDTVCFSGVPLRELLGRRRFQSHLGRWDWEPYGIAIRRSWLEARGAKPVEYLNARDLDRCPPERLPFAQPIGDAARSVDWTREREWRIADDLRLQDLAMGDGFLFVATKMEAACLAHYAKWPVLYEVGANDQFVREGPVLWVEATSHSSYPN